VHDSPYPLPACIFRFQNYCSPFLTWANCKGRNWTRKKNNQITAPALFPVSACPPFPLVAWNPFFQNRLSPFVFCLASLSPGRKIPVFGREHFL
jgi:hypothetical protein